MNLATPSNACMQWLQQSLRDLKNARVQDSPSSVDLPVTRERLLAALYAGNRAVAQDLCDAHDRAFGRARASVMDLILPSVYQIEEQWLAGARSYGEVLCAYWHVQGLLQRDAQGLRQPPHMLDMPVQGQVVLATVPGCEHTLGVWVVSESFRAWGWQVTTVLEGGREALVQAVSQRPVDFLGLSVGHDAALEGLVDLLKHLRASSCNPALRILVGGNIFDMPAAQYDWIGADYLAATANDALQYCASMFQRPAH